ncbi:MAG: M23 family metallopeptidase [Gemmatimonadota bacterium]
MKIRLGAMLLGVLALLAAGFAVAHPRSPVDSAAAATLTPVYAPPVDAEESHVLHSGETLSEVLERARLSRSELNGLALAMREMIDPRRILPNTSVLVRRWLEDGRPRAVDVVLNADSTMRLSRDPVGWQGEMVLTPTEVDTVVVAGVLGDGGSIYRAIVNHPELDLPSKEKEALVWKLAHIYGWELDFAHDMRPGDTFRVVYEREARPDGTSRAAKVLVAEIVNRTRPLHAIYFDPGDDRADYFNDEGRSLRLAFLRYPVDYPRITSNFSWRRYHPILKQNRPHYGTDFGAARGTPVKTTADGVVAQASWDGGYGNLVRIDHGNGYETRYAHLHRFGKGIRPGARVDQGQIIGYAGSTGMSTAPHVHYEMRRYGKPLNPRTVRIPAAPPVPEEHMATFRLLSAERLALLPRLDAPADSALAD